MSRKRIVLILFGVFVLASLIAAYFENNYRILVRFLFNYFQGDNIKFVGKNFHLFPSAFQIISFGLFSVLLTYFLFRESKTRKVQFLFLTIALFTAATAATSYIDSSIKIIECTACKDGIRELHYNGINYNLHFIFSVIAAAVPLVWSLLRQKLSNKRR